MCRKEQRQDLDVARGWVYGRRAEFGSRPHLQLLLAASHGEDRVCGAVLRATGIEYS